MTTAFFKTEDVPNITGRKAKLFGADITLSSSVSGAPDTLIASLGPAADAILPIENETFGSWNANVHQTSSDVIWDSDIKQLRFTRAGIYRLSLSCQMSCGLINVLGDPELGYIPTGGAPLPSGYLPRFVEWPDLAFGSSIPDALGTHTSSVHFLHNVGYTSWNSTDKGPMGTITGIDNRVLSKDKPRWSDNYLINAYEGTTAPIRLYTLKSPYMVEGGIDGLSQPRYGILPFAQISVTRLPGGPQGVNEPFMTDYEVDY